MNKNHFFTLIMFFLLTYSKGYSQDLVLFKQVDTTKLFIEILYPENMDSSKDYPSMVFFFGGGWVHGDRTHFLDQAKYFTKRGMVCFLADYRTESKNKTTPFESLKDAKSAIRYIRKHASDYGIDANKIVASGGSAGGHLACATALIETYNDAADDLSLNCKPNALVLFNPVFDNGPGGYGYERIGDAYKDFSPLHNIEKGAPPTIVFLGTNDELIPVETAKYYQKVMEKVNSRCELILYKNQVHGFFNKFRSMKYFKSTLTEADKFLQSLGYLEKEPVIKIEK